MRRKIIEIDEDLCNGCGNCVSACAEQAIKLIDGKAKLVSDTYCDGLGDCIGHCPTGALKVVERDAEPFDESIVVKHKPAPCSCPSSTLDSKKLPLNNWPIQLALVPETAEYFKDADLLVSADCTAFSALNYHHELLNDKILLICCPKLDQTEHYINKLKTILIRNTIKTITVVRMSVPCCAKLTVLVRLAVQMSGENIEFKELVITEDDRFSVAREY